LLAKRADAAAVRKLLGLLGTAHLASEESTGGDEGDTDGVSAVCAVLASTLDALWRGRGVESEAAQAARREVCVNLFLFTQVCVALTQVCVNRTQVAAATESVRAAREHVPREMFDAVIARVERLASC
jgi:hypothetical protein